MFQARQSATSAGATWARRIVVGLALFVALVALIGFFVVPPVAKHQIEKLASAEFEREVTVESIAFNPFTLKATARGLAVRDRFGPQPLLAIDEVLVDFSAKSLFQLAPVIEQLKVTRPVASVIRLDRARYNFSDIVDRQLQRPHSENEGPAKFALYNLELVDGRVDFDDRPEKLKHEVTGIQIGVPFVSSFSTDVDINVQPKLEATVNGDPLRIGAETKPFKDTLETTVDLDYTDIDLPRYVAYVPVKLNLRMPSGKLDTKLRVVFATKGGKPETLTVTGTAAVRDLVVQHANGAPAAAFKVLSVALDRVEVIQRHVAVKTVRLDAPELHITRRNDGSISVLDLVPFTAVRAEQSNAPPERPTKPFTFSVGEFVLAGGRAELSDEVPQKGFKAVLAPIDLTVKGLSNAPAANAEVALSLLTDSGARIDHTGTVSLTPLAARGHLDTSGLKIAQLVPYYDPFVNLEVADGSLDLATDYSVGGTNGALNPRLENLSLALTQLRLLSRGVKEALWRIPRLEAKAGSIDVAKQQITIGECTVKDAVGYVLRAANGKTQYDALIKRVDKSTPATESAPDQSWTVVVNRLTGTNTAVTIDDRVPSPAVVTRITRMNVSIDGASNVKGREAKLASRGNINQLGSFDVSGPVSGIPPKGRLTVRTRNVSLAPFQPYIDDKVNITFNGGSVSNNGAVAIEAAPDRPLKLAYRGDVNITDLAAVSKPEAQDLLRWKALYLGGINFTLEPFKADVNEVSLTDFFARVILNADGTFNLQQLGAQEAAPPQVTAMPQETTPAASRAPAKPQSIEAAAQAAAAQALPPNVRLGKITFANGNVNYSDFFVKPNYTANLTGLAGTVTEMTPEKPGDVEIRAKLDNAAPVTIDGRINALSRDLFVDLKASAKGIDLPPLSPYSMKYAGYGIEKGKLSVTVKYLIENRKLAAENNIFLDQLTFGEKVESPTATKLPVLLAVALLKDRNGVIDINLPISGSLDDPQFSVGGLIVRVIVNLITKAVTAPFALIGAAFGGGAELSFVEFDLGGAGLNDAAVKRLEALAKALDSRPGLKLDVSGRVDPAVDREGLKRRSLERKVKAAKLKELTSEGKAPASVDEIVVDKSEYERYLRQAYREEKFQKPRNVLGLVKDIPAPEMESLMLANTQVSDEELRVLANGRAQAAKEFLVEKGRIASERIFLVAPKLNAEGIKEGKPTRADFSLK